MKSKIEMLAVADVIPTSDNPRTVIHNDPKVKELAESIKANGLLQPIVCRPHPKKAGKFDLRAGFRRYLAHQVLGLTEIMAIVRPMDDKTAMEVTVLENLQREQLSPMEEARGIKALLESGQDVKTISAEIGKSAVWVLRRAKLMNLSPKWMAAIEDPKSDQYQSATAVLELVCRFDHHIQDSFIGQWWARYPEIDKFQEQVAEFTKRLKLAPWPLGNGMLYPKAGACQSCVKRSSRQPGLFDDELDPEKIQADDQCLDAFCWAEKSRIFTALKEEELRAKHPNLLRVATNNHCPDENEKPFLKEWDYEKAKQSTPGAKPAIVVHGPGEGKLIWVKPRRDRSDGTGQWKRGEDGQIKPLSMKEKQEQLRHRRMAWVIRRIVDIIDKSTLADGKCPLKDHALLTYSGAYGGNYNAAYSGDDYKPLEKMLTNFSGNSRAAAKQVWRHISGVLKRRLELRVAENAVDRWDEAMALAKMMGMPPEQELMRQAAEEIPDPKSWAVEK